MESQIPLLCGPVLSPIYLAVLALRLVFLDLRRPRDARGYEIQFATNHWGHFQPAARLWKALKNSGNANALEPMTTTRFIDGSLISYSGGRDASRNSQR